MGNITRECPMHRDPKKSLAVRILQDALSGAPEFAAASRDRQVTRIQQQHRRQVATKSEIPRDCAGKEDPARLRLDPRLGQRQSGMHWGEHQLHFTVVVGNRANLYRKSPWRIRCYWDT